jgi:hypothetical protein
MDKRGKNEWCRGGLICRSLQDKHELLDLDLEKIPISVNSPIRLLHHRSDAVKFGRSVFVLVTPDSPFSTVGKEPRHGGPSSFLASSLQPPFDYVLTNPPCYGRQTDKQIWPSHLTMKKVTTTFISGYSSLFTARRAQSHSHRVKPSISQSRLTASNPSQGTQNPSSLIWHPKPRASLGYLISLCLFGIFFHRHLLANELFFVHDPLCPVLVHRQQVLIHICHY